MRRAFPLLTIALLGALPAQDLRLVERVPSPLAYVAVSPGAEPGAPGLQTLLDDPTVRHLLAPGGDAASDASLSTLERLRGLLALSTGEIELVLNGILPRADAPALPLLLCRVRLSDDGRERLEAALSDPAIAEPSREIDGHRTFVLKAVSKRRPGSLFELALVGRDLLVTNHVSSIEEVLHAGRPISSTGTTDAGSGRHPESLAADPAFEGLRRRLEGGPGTALVHLDWRRLRERALAELDPGRVLMMQGAGLLGADRIAIGMRAVDGALLTTVLIDQPQGIDGLLSAAKPASVRRLAQDLPGQGIAAVAFSFEPQRLRELAESRRHGGPLGSFHANLCGGCRRIGLDFDAQLAPRLGDSGMCRLVLLEDDHDRAALALSFQARSARAARGIVTDVRETLQRFQLPLERRGHGDREVLVLSDGARDGASVGVVGDSVVLGLHPDAVERVAELERTRSRRTRGVSTQSLLDRLVAARGLDPRSAVGVIEVDGQSFVGSADGRSGRHAGVILLDGDALRIELISPL